MNGTVAPPSSRSTAARTCSVFAAMSWAIRCSMLCMGAFRIPAATPSCAGWADQTVDDTKRMLDPGRRRVDTKTAPRGTPDESGAERIAVVGRGRVRFELAGAAVQYQGAGNHVVQALFAPGPA